MREGYSTGKIAAAALLLFGLTATPGLPGERLEGFLSTQYRDAANTTAWWDTTAGELRLQPFAMSLVGNLDTPGNAYDVEVAGDYAYVADWSWGLRVIDISDPTQPTAAGSYNTPGYASGVAVDGDLAYVADDASGLHVLDVSDPGSPRYLGTYDTPGYARGVAVSGDLAYVADYESGLLILDVSDPASPQYLGAYDTPGKARSVAVAGDYAFVADDASGVTVVNVSDPASPAYAGVYDTPSYTYEVVIAGNHACVADYGSGLLVLDITNPTAPALAGSRTVPGQAYGVALAGDWAYVAAFGYGLHAVDIADPTNPVRVGTIDTDGQAQKVVVAGERAYVADHGSGLKVIRVAEPLDTPVLKASIDLGVFGTSTVIEGNLACVQGPYDGLKIVDISDPSSPVLSGSHPSCAIHMDVDGDFAYSACGYLRVLDIADPAAPESIGAFLCPSAYDVSVAGDIAYVANSHWPPFRIVDVSDPAAPSLLADYDLEGIEPLWIGQRIFVQGDVAILLCRYSLDMNDSGLVEIVDVSDPSNPAFLGREIWERGFNRGACLDGDHLYAASGSEVRVLDVGDPAAPTTIARYAGVSAPNVMAVSGDRLFVGDGLTGVEVLDVSDPAHPTRLGVLDIGTDPTSIVLDGDYAWVGGFDSTFSALRIFDRSLDAQANEARSTMLPETDEVRLVRLTTEEEGAIDWEVTADGGAHWETILPGAGWLQLATSGNDLRWRSVLNYDGDDVPVCDWARFEWQTVTGVDGGGAPRVFALHPAVPNPFNPTTVIPYDLPEPADVRLTIHDAAGRRVTALVDGPMPAGAHTAIWDGADARGREAGSGTYFARVRAGEHEATRRLVLLR